MANETIVVSGLTKQYRKVRAVDNLSFTVSPGRVTGFLGPNGAGKTTTLRMLLNLVTPTAGTATIGGSATPTSHDPLRAGRRGPGGVERAQGPHRPQPPADHRAPRPGCPLARADEVLELVGLTPAAKRKFRGYSLGMRQRLGHRRGACSATRGVLILDEPANGLDPEGIRWMRDLLKALAGEGRTVLVSSHLLSEMELLADDVVIIADGKLVRPGAGRARSSAAMASRAGAGAHARRRRSCSQRAADRRQVEHRRRRRAGGDRRRRARGRRGRARAGVALHELVTERPDLEQVFLELTAGKAGIR